MYSMVPDNSGAQPILKQPGTRANPDLLETSLCKQAMHENFCAVVKRKHKYYLILLLNSRYILRTMTECLIFQQQLSQSLKRQLQHEKVVVFKENKF